MRWGFRLCYLQLDPIADVGLIGFFLVDDCLAGSNPIQGELGARWLTYWSSWGRRSDWDFAIVFAMRRPEWACEMKPSILWQGLIAFCFVTAIIQLNAHPKITSGFILFCLLCPRLVSVTRVLIHPHETTDARSRLFLKSVRICFNDIDFKAPATLR